MAKNHTAYFFQKTTEYDIVNLYVFQRGWSKMFLNIILFCCVCGIIPILLGSLYIEDESKAMSNSLISCYAQGMFTMWGIFQIIGIPLIFLRKSLDFLTVVYSVIVVALCLFALIRGPKKISSIFKIKTSWKDSMKWQMVLAILLIAFQTIMLTVKTHTDDDDAFYTASATTALETNTIFAYNPYTGALFEALPSRYVLSPIFSFVAMLAKITRVHPAIISHTLFPAMLIPMAYMIYMLIGNKLFKEKKTAVGTFLIFVSLIQMFSAYSVYTTGVFTLTRIWQGKAIFAAVLFPAILYFGLSAFEAQKGTKRSWISLLFLMLASCMVSSMGILLSVVALGILALVYAIQKKQPRVLIYSVLCCIPNLIYAGMYLILK